MKFIGITGGAGAGKSKILRYIEQEYPAKIVLADELAHELMQSGSECFAKLKDAFEGEDIYTKEGGFDSAKLAAVIFSDSGKRETLNKIVHPAVKQEILRLVEKERKEEIYSYFILEAALLIEEGYDKICDELWLIDAAEPIRRKRLKETRGYSDEKIDDILGSQLSDSEYRRHCAVVIENNGTLDMVR